METLRIFFEYTALAMEAIGVLILLIGIVVGLGRFIAKGNKQREEAYRNLRHDLGKAILLGLEVLIAADIIATVVTEPTMDRVLVLGLIVIIRIILSLSIQVELEGKFPWQTKSNQNEIPNT